MRVLRFGNSGSGKSHCAAQLAAAKALAHLDLDRIFWEPDRAAVQRPMPAVRADLADVVAGHRRWAIEGCDGELIEAVVPLCTELVFLNPGLETCLANNRRRPWAAHKCPSKQAQDAMLPALLEWVRGYDTRNDDGSYARHRRLYDSFAGRKRELTSVATAR